MIILQSNFVPKNQTVDKTWISIVKGINILHYIPSASSSAQYFDECKTWYNSLGIPTIVQFDIDLHYDEQKIDTLFSCDAIFLSGGNTYYFLSLLQKHNLIDRLRTYIEQGGICIGVSAGAILMSPTIGIAEFGDENQVGLQDLSSLNIIDFEFFPHFNGKSETLLSLQKRANATQKSIYVCKDGDGIIIKDKIIHQIGDIIVLSAMKS